MKKVNQEHTDWERETKIGMASQCVQVLRQRYVVNLLKWFWILNF